MLTKDDLKNIGTLLDSRLDSKINPLRDNLSNLDSKFGSLYSNINSKVDSLDSKIIPLGKIISILNSKFDSLEKDFNNFTIVVKNQFDRVEKNIRKLKFDVNEIKTDIVEIKGDIKTFNKIQNNQIILIDKHTDDIRLLKNKIKLV